MQDIREELQAALGTCLGHEARRAARAITNRFNDELRCQDLNVAQIGVLFAIARDPDRTLTVIADALALDETTLTRNLHILERRGLIELDGGRGRAGKKVHLTNEGWELMQPAMETWRRVNTELTGQFTPDELAFGFKFLRALEGAASSGRAQSKRVA